MDNPEHRRLVLGDGVEGTGRGVRMLRSMQIAGISKPRSLGTWPASRIDLLMVPGRL